jgi:hypothetical protein
MARRDGLQVVQAQGAVLGVLDGLGTELLGEHLVARPPRAKVGARLLERRDERCEVRVADTPRVLSAKAGERVAGGVPPRLAVRTRAREEPP